MDLPNKRKCKRLSNQMARLSGPFEMDPAYQDKVSLKIVCLKGRNIWLKELKCTDIFR